MCKEQLAKYAYEKSLFYREYIGNYDEKFEELPVVTKEQIVTSYVPIVPVDKLLRVDESEVIELHTSGSNGKSFSVKWENKDYLKSMTELWFLRKKYYGITPRDKMCYFYTIRALGDEEKREYLSGNTLGFSKIGLSEKRFEEIYSMISDYEPDWLLVQPGIMKQFLDVMKKKKLRPIDSIRYIEFSGEKLEDEVRKRTEEFFQCEIADQYGCYEANSIAYECPYGNKHIMSSNVYVETINEDDIVITSLTNRMTPFVRYRIGDHGKILNGKCNCGNRNPILELTTGREMDYILCEDGTELNAYIFNRAIENVNVQLDDVVKQFQVVQKDINEFTVKLYVDNISQAEEIEVIFRKNILDEKLDKAKFEFEFSREYLNSGGEKIMCFTRLEFNKEEIS